MKSPNKLGRFTVSNCFLQDWQNCLWLFGNFVIVESRHRFDTDCTEYMAYSELFDEIEHHTAAPEYEIKCSNTVPPTVWAERIKSK